MATIQLRSATYQSKVVVFDTQSVYFPTVICHSDIFASKDLLVRACQMQSMLGMDGSVRTAITTLESRMGEPYSRSRPELGLCLRRRVFVGGLPLPAGQSKAASSCVT